MHKTYRIALILLVFSGLYGTFHHEIALAKDKTRKTVSIGVDNRFPPWIIMDGTGIQQVIIKELFNNIGYDVNYVSTPRQRGAFLTNSGILDGFILHKEDTEYSDLSLMPVAITEFDVNVFSKNDKKNIRSSCDLRKFNIGVLHSCEECLSLIEDCIVTHTSEAKGDKHSTTIASPTADIQKRDIGDWAKSIVYPTKLENLFQMLMTDRIDIAITDKFGGKYIIRKMDLKDIHVQPGLGKLSKNYLFLHSKHKALIDPLKIEMIKLSNSKSYDNFLDYY